MNVIFFEVKELIVFLKFIIKSIRKFVLILYLKFRSLITKVNYW